MKKLLKNGILLLTFLSVVTLNIKAESKQRLYYKNKIQHYWYESPDSAIILADSAIILYKKNHDLQNIYYFNILKGIALYFKGETEKSIKCFRASLEKGDKYLPERIIANTNSMLMLAYRNLGKYDSAVFYGKLALKLMEEKIKDSNDLAGAYDNLSTVYRKIGEYDSAIHYSLKAARIFEETGNKKELAYVWGNLSYLFKDIQDKKNTFYYSKKSLQTLKALNDEVGYAEALFNLGDYYMENNQLDTALIYYKQSAKLSKKLERYDKYATALKSIGAIYLRYGQTLKAEKILLQAYKQFKKSNQLENLAETTILLAKTEYKKSNFEYSESLLNDVQQISAQINSGRLKRKILKEKVALYEHWGKTKKALQVFHHLDKLKDSLNIIKLNNKIEELTTKYHLKKINTENRKLKQQQVINEMKNRQMRILTNLLAIGTLLIVVIFLLLLQKHKKNALLQKQKMELIKKEEELMRSDLEKAELKKNELRKENQFKAKQLTTYTLNMMQKNLIFQDLLKEVKEIERMDSRHMRKSLLNLKIKLINALSSDSDWENFKLFFEQVNADFFKRLHENYPQLTKTDEKLCALIRLNMNINEAASVLNVNYNSIRVARYRLRKKMNLKPDDDLYEIIQKV